MKKKIFFLNDMCRPLWWPTNGINIEFDLFFICSFIWIWCYFWFWYESEIEFGLTSSLILIFFYSKFTMTLLGHHRRPTFPIFSTWRRSRPTTGGSKEGSYWRRRGEHPTRRRTILHSDWRNSTDRGGWSDKQDNKRNSTNKR